MKPFSYLAYLLVRAVYGLLRILPESWVYAAARGLGSLLHRVLPRLRRVTEANLRRALGPQAPQKEIERLAKEAFRHFATVSLEGPLLAKHLRPGRWTSFCEFPAEKVSEILARGKGMVLLAPHFGNWEAMNLAVGLAGFSHSAISRPLKNPYLVEYFRKMREAYGAKLVPRRGGFRDLLPVFRAGGIGTLMPDQNQRKRPIFVPWFGKLAATDRSPAFIAMRLGVPAVAIATLRVGRGFRFRTELVEIEPPPSTGDRESDEAAFAERVHRVLEGMILRQPEQYFWLHDRYRTRPPGESVALESHKTA